MCDFHTTAAAKNEQCIPFVFKCIETFGSFLEKEVVQETVPGARRRGRPCTAWMDDIKMWTGLPVEELVRISEDRDKWRKYVHDVADHRIEDG